MYELAFESAPMSGALLDKLYDEFDAVVSKIDGTTRIDLIEHGHDGVSAARTAIRRLRGLGVKVLRPIDDLVSRTEIAERAGVTTQAVGLWARGERQGAAFPKPYITAGSTRLWRWGEVVEFLGSIR